MSERFSPITAVDKLAQINELLMCLHLIITNEETKSFRNPHLGLIITIQEMIQELSANMISLKHLIPHEDEYED